MVRGLLVFKLHSRTNLPPEYRLELDPEMPVVNAGAREKPVYLPVEVCQVEPGQPVGSKLSPNQTSNMLKFAVISRKPAQNAQSIATKGVGMLGLGEPLNATLVRTLSLSLSAVMFQAC